MLKQLASVKTSDSASAAIGRGESSLAETETEANTSDEDPPGPIEQEASTDHVDGVKKKKKSSKRLNAGYLNEETYQQIKAVFEEHNLSMGEGLRIGVQIFAKAVPVLAEGGQLVFRSVDGTEERYKFPFL